MNSSNEKNKSNKQHYLIEKIFISENDTHFDDIASFNEKFKFIIKNNNINNFILEQFNTIDQITLFYKNYKYDKKEKLLYNYNKLIYFCYRSNIFPIQNKLNLYLFRDSGWGCMIRCGQMIMSRAIYKYLKSKKFSTEKAIYETIKYFLDLPYSEKAVPSIFSSILSYNLNTNNNKNIKIFPPFSIHMHCFLGKFYNKHGGEWFSDVNVCQNYCEINKYLNLFPELSILSFVSDFKLEDILDECFIFINEDEKNCKIENIINFNNKKYVMKKCGLFFISARLGINKITNEYYSSLKKIFECKECIGIIGGETNLAHYFIGYNSRGNLIYLDPHITRESVKYLNDDSIVNDYLVKNLHEISIDDMSTALSFGFLFRSIDEFKDIVNFFENYCKNAYPCFGYVKKNVEIDINKYQNLFNDEDDF